MNEYIQCYIKKLNEYYQTEEARELSYRSALQTLIESITGCTALNEGKRRACGSPDITIIKNGIVLSFVETKDIDDHDLDGQKKHAEQFERYKNALSTIIFTDYLEFHLYIEGELQRTVRIAENTDGYIIEIPSEEGQFISMIESLRNAKPQKITSAKRLAQLMAAKARLLRDVIATIIEKDKDEKSDLVGQMKAFQQVLIHDIDAKKFADIYAQTIAYGLFAARINDPTPESFSRIEAATLIPNTNPFLQQMFQHIAGYSIQKDIQWIVDDLVKIFGATDMKKVMKNFGKETQRTDPIVHFYEDFLSVYDPAAKKQYGVYYTPLPVVDFIVRSVDDVLRKEFNIQDGLADTTKIEVPIKRENQETKKIETTAELRHRVQILDPATGTGTFLAEIIRLIKNNIQKGMWPKYVEEHLIPRIHGFELMMAPYTIAHLKLDMLLNWWTDGEKLSVPHKDRLHIYLTNSLEQELLETKISFANMIAKEANEANDVKHNTPVMVVIGNPPYSGISQNNGKWITDLMEDYKKEPNSTNRLDEKKNWVNNDYCKFIRLAQDYVKRNKVGIFAYVCANSFLDRPTFRGMRWNLLTNFDKIYIINLHGSSIDKEKCPDGSKDENIFDITIGTSINIFIKTGQKKENELADVYYAEKYGIRQDKYQFLAEHDLGAITFEKVTLSAPYFSFIPKSEEGKEEYESGFKIDELMPINISGITTARDNLVIDANKEVLLHRIKDFIDPTKSTNEIRKIFFGNRKAGKYLQGDSRGWKLDAARKKIALFNHETKIQKISYRIFDTQYIYYCPEMVDWGREKVMRHMLKDNIALVAKNGFPHFEIPYAFVSESMIDDRFWSCSGMAGIDFVFPLYLYDYSNTPKRLNMNEDILKRVAEIINYPFPLEDLGESLFNYIYGVLHSPTYREKYKEFLKVDFPRVPYPKNKEDFDHFATLGNQLRELHLMHNVPSMPTIATFYGEGNGIVEGIAFEPNKDDGYSGNVYINNGQCFENVPTSAWNFYIGGYQPAQKWLKDRKGRELSYDDMKHYQKIIATLLETDRLMKLL